MYFEVWGLLALALLLDLCVENLTVTLRNRQEMKYVFILERKKDTNWCPF